MTRRGCTWGDRALVLGPVTFLQDPQILQAFDLRHMGASSGMEESKTGGSGQGPSPIWTLVSKPHGQHKG